MSRYDVPRRCRHVETLEPPAELTTRVAINRWLYARQEENCSACVAVIERDLKREHERTRGEEGMSN